MAFNICHNTQYRTLDTHTIISDNAASGPFIGVTMTTPGLSGCDLLRGDSNPESRLLSDELLLKDRVRGSSIPAPKVQGLGINGTVRTGIQSWHCGQTTTLSHDSIHKMVFRHSIHNVISLFGRGTTSTRVQLKLPNAIKCYT